MNRHRQQNTTSIHFVCTGNVYRSRLAEAYLNAKQIPQFHCSSSGTRAEALFIEYGPITWYGMRLMGKHRLISFMSCSSQQTVPDMITQADVVIFMRQQHYDYTVHQLHLSPLSFQIWDIPDIHEQMEIPAQDTREHALAVIEASEQTFEQICQSVNTLVESLKHMQ